MTGRQATLVSGSLPGAPRAAAHSNNMFAEVGGLPVLDFDIEAELQKPELVPTRGATRGLNLEPTATVSYGLSSNSRGMWLKSFPQPYAESASMRSGGRRSSARATKGQRTAVCLDQGDWMALTPQPWAKTRDSRFGVATVPTHVTTPGGRFVQQVLPSSGPQVHGQVLGANGYSGNAPPNLSASSSRGSQHATSLGSSGFASGRAYPGNYAAPQNTALTDARAYIRDALRQQRFFRDQSPLHGWSLPNFTTDLQCVDPRP